MNKYTNIDMRIVGVIKSTDNITKKFEQETGDGYFIESVYVDYNNKHIICFSTQIGCRLGCRFCYNGCLNQFIRNLSVEEICIQIENMLLYLNILDDKPILFSAMGIGEPLCNYDNVMTAMNILHSRHCNSRFALATTGINNQRIYDLIKDTANLNFKLTVSLHSAIEKDRKWLIPGSGSLKVLLDAVEEYQKYTGRMVEYNVVLIEGVNDSTEHSKAICELMYNRGIERSSIIKLNRFNNIQNSKFKESTRTNGFYNELISYGLEVELYETNGSDIGAACGQLISGRNKNNGEYIEWKV